MKFGGTSVGDGAAFKRAARIAADEARKRPTAVVVSAMRGVTDTLLGYAEATANGQTPDRTSTGATREGSLSELHRSLYSRHLLAAREAVNEEHLPEVEKRIFHLLAQLSERINDRGISDDHEARAAEVATHGERLSAEILAGAMKSLGGVIEAAVAEDPIVTDSEFGEADICASRTRERCSENVSPLLEAGVAAVVPGYVGRTPEGRVTTLGRGGSDLSATAIGRALDAFEVWIMSDVNGILDADPRLVPEAATLPQLSYREAHLFAGLGAKVLHPKTMEPVAEAGIEVRVRNTFEPETDGTRISSRECGEGVRCVALRSGLSVERIAFANAADERIFCVIGTSGDEICVLADDDAGGEAAAIVGIGSPRDEDLVRGLGRLAEEGVRPLWAGNIASGLVFVVEAEVSREALCALHGSLVVEREEVLAGEAVA